MNVFEIKKEFFALKELMEKEYEVDEETGEFIDNTEILKELALGLNENMNDKADAIIYIYKEMVASEGLIHEEIKRLTERKKMYKRKQEQLKELMDFLLEGKKLKTEKFTIFYGKSESLVIEDEDKIPSKYISFEPKINKKDIKDDIKLGEEIEGATVVENISVRWR